MDARGALLVELARQPVCGYRREATPATESTALAALALLAHGEVAAAREAASWLQSCQSRDGSVGIRQQEPTPQWPTSLAVLTWLASDAQRFSTSIERAVAWILATRGERVTTHENVAHDTQLLGWPWVTGTHSWVEPTALHVRALKAAGHQDHARCREAVRLLLDRQLPTGGCNYGNTIVLGQTLRAHVQPTGMALFGLVGERDEQGRIERSRAFVESAISEQTTAASLCWALLGLTAHGRRPPEADRWLESVSERTLHRDASPYKCALLALAAAGSEVIAG